MKKWIIIATLFLLIGGIGMGFTFKEAFNQEADIVEETYAADNINNLTVKSNNSMVSIRPSASDEILVTYEGDIDRNTIKTEVIDGTLDIEVKGKWQYNIISFNFLSFIDHIQIELPERLYEKITVENDNGKIALQQIDSKNMDLRTANGVIDVKEVTGDVLAHSDNGLIKVEAIDGNLDIGTSNGALNMTDVTGDIIGKTANGAINYQTDTIKQNIQLQSENGAIKIKLTEALDDVLLDMKSEVGTTRVNGSKDWEPKIGNGRYEVKLKTEVGTIKIMEE